MRVVACLTAAAWLLTLADPCPRPAACGAQAQHRCCCDKHEQCPCQLKPHGAAAPQPVAAFAEVSKDQPSLPAAETAPALAAQAAAATLACTFAGPSAPSPPVYLSSHAFRC